MLYPNGLKASLLCALLSLVSCGGEIEYIPVTKSDASPCANNQCSSPRGATPEQPAGSKDPEFSQGSGSSSGGTMGRGGSCPNNQCERPQDTCPNNQCARAQAPCPQGQCGQNKGCIEEQCPNKIDMGFYKEYGNSNGNDGGIQYNNNVMADQGIRYHDDPDAGMIY
jgi:hypothetical protein